jgi:hypothetical protein
MCGRDRIDRFMPPELRAQRDKIAARFELTKGHSN